MSHSGRNRPSSAAASDVADRIYTQADVNAAVKAALFAEREQIEQGRAARERLAELDAERAEGKAPAANHEALVHTAAASEMNLSQLIIDMAGSAGARNAAAVAGLIDTEQVTYDEHGEPSNLAELVNEALLARPYLRDPASVAVTRMSTDQGAREGRTSSVDDALRLLEAAPAEFDRMVARGLIPKDVFGGRR